MPMFSNSECLQLVGAAERADHRSLGRLLRGLIAGQVPLFVREAAVTPTAAQLNQYMLTMDIADGSADTTYYLVCPHAGAVTNIQTVIDGAVGTADITVTARIGSTAMTNGVVTIATAASAAGDVDNATPSALNTVTAGQAINFVVAGGGSGGSPRIHLVATITRT